MSDFNGILKEITNTAFQSPIDIVRKKTLKDLYKTTGRNVIAYYSGFLTSADNPAVAIEDNDVNGFMTVIRGLDKTKGLDLIIQSPGGDVGATEAIGNYLRKIYHLKLSLTYMN